MDGIVFMPLLLVEQWLFKSTQNNSVITVWVIFSAFIPILYSIFLHYKYGQTIGKWVADVKVLHVSETRSINLKESILRDIPFLLIQVIALFYFVFPTPGNSIEHFSDFSSTPLFIWNLLELITMLTNPKRRAIHDFLAKSVVIRTATSG